MSWIVASVAGGQSIMQNGIGGTGGDVIKGLTGGDFREAAAAQTEALNRAIDTQKDMFNQIRTDNEPWRQAGVGALGGLGSKDFQRDFTMNDFQADPGYQFRMNEAMKALQQSAAARGSLGSTGTMKNMLARSSDLASQEYNNAYSRFNADRDRRFNRLASVAGLGQTATANTGNAGMNSANNISDYQVGIGNAQAGGITGQGNWYRQRWTDSEKNMTSMGGGMMGLMASDVRVKKNIEHFDPSEVLNTLKPYTWEYIDPKFGQGRFAGVMVHDLERTEQGREFIKDVNGVKHVDYLKMIPMLLATVVHLNQEIAALKKAG